MDPYRVLQVDRDAEDVVIQAAYRRLARKLHPDSAEGPDEQAFRQVVAAWELLSDPVRRARWDVEHPRPIARPPGPPSAPPRPRRVLPVFLGALAGFGLLCAGTATVVAWALMRWGAASPTVAPPLAPDLASLEAKLRDCRAAQRAAESRADRVPRGSAIDELNDTALRCDRLEGDVLRLRARIPKTSR